MRIPRIYHPDAITLGQTFSLNADAANHVGRVLRMTPPQQIVIFNGDGHDYLAELVDVGKKQVHAKPISQSKIDNESPISIHLAQGVSRGDKMDFTIQKSVELGVTEITPIFTERCGVKLKGDRLEKKLQQWQKIAISACEQSGRAVVPKIHPAITLNEFLAQKTEQLKLNLHPRATTTVKGLTLPASGVRFIIGPEGGLSSEEIEVTVNSGYQEIQLGPRVLRTETAALTLLSALQMQFGDLG